jgi:hypothetical protein
MLLSLIYVMNCKDGDVRCDINQRGGLYFAGGTFTAEEEIRCFEITHYIKKMEVTQQGEWEDMGLKRPGPFKRENQK